MSTKSVAQELHAVARTNYRLELVEAILPAIVTRNGPGRPDDNLAEIPTDVALAIAYADRVILKLGLIP